jgi:hypothetical protein
LIGSFTALYAFSSTEPELAEEAAMAVETGLILRLRDAGLVLANKYVSMADITAWEDVITDILDRLMMQGGLDDVRRG